MLRQRVQLGLLHVAIALAIFPVDSIFNRILISDLRVSALLTALFATLPYAFSPIQLFIGTLADRFPMFGRRRSPYILIGVLLAAAGVSLAPIAIYLVPENATLGIFLCFGAFGLLGMGYNFATVSYFSLAAELSGDKSSSKTIATMYFMMILTMIITGITLGRVLEPFSISVFYGAMWGLAGVIVLLGVLGLINLEPHMNAPNALATQTRASMGQMLPLFTKNRHARRFFIYMIVLLAAILGQDLIVEPFAAEVLGFSVGETTRITSVYGTAFLLALILGGLLEGRLTKRTVAIGSGIMAIAAFALIILSGITVSAPLFYGGLLVLGTAIGLSTVSNHAIMLEMTTPANVGLFIGAWGMASAFARLLGQMTSGLVLDLFADVTAFVGLGYLIMFGIKIGFLLFSLWQLSRLDIEAFRTNADTDEAKVDLTEQAAMAGQAME